ncbi:MAG: TolC family protein [Candidatus Eisenbacteria bacterium]|nr:TolC family protein [Candidatus Eisenbacteria bacterium]
MRQVHEARRAERAARPVRAGVAVLLALALMGGGPAAAAERLELTLREAVELGLAGSRELAIADSKVVAADARRSQAASTFFPQLSASGSYTRLDEAPSMDLGAFGGEGKIYLGDDDIYSIGLTVQQPLFTGGALLSAHGAARHAANAEVLARRRSEDEARYGITGAYLGLVQAREALKVMDDAVAQMSRHLADVEALYEQGMMIGSDALLARVRMAEVELGRTRARHAVSLANAALAFSLGVSLDTEIEPTDPLAGAALPERSLEAWTGAALAARSDLGAMREAVGAAGKGVSIARSGYLPRVMAIGTYAWDRPDRQYEPEFYEHWHVTLAAEMSIFDWGATRGRVREARAGLAQAERSRELLEDAVRLDVRRSFLAREEATAALSIAEGAAAQASEGLRVARESFRSGVVTSSAVLDAQASLTGAEMSRIAALAGLRLAEAGLLLAAGVAGE